MKGSPFGFNILFHVRNNEVGRKANSEDHLNLYKLIIAPLRFPTCSISKFPDFIAPEEVIVLHAYNKTTKRAIRYIFPSPSQLT